MGVPAVTTGAAPPRLSSRTAGCTGAEPVFLMRTRTSSCSLRFHCPVTGLNRTVPSAGPPVKSIWIDLPSALEVPLPPALATICLPPSMAAAFAPRSKPPAGRARDRVGVHVGLFARRPGGLNLLNVILLLHVGLADENHHLGDRRWIQRPAGLSVLVAEDGGHDGGGPRLDRENVGAPGILLPRARVIHAQVGADGFGAVVGHLHLDVAEAAHIPSHFRAGG